MAYIPPNSTVQYFSDLGLSRDDTLYFDSVSSKNTYFSNLTKIASEESLTYVSREKGIIRSSLPMSTAINIGYMRYRNTNFENFWFYAYVTEVEYINNGLTEIHFEIDNMITYMGVFTLGECFVERQHVLNDAIGANLCDERLEYGDYKYRKIQGTDLLDTLSIVVQASVDVTGTAAPGEMYGNTYSGLHLIKFRTASAVNEFLDKLTDTQKSEAIVSINMIPESFSTSTSDSKEIVIAKPYTDIDGYTPHNNKLFIYPYNYITVTNLQGNFADFRYEFFSGNSAYFSLEGKLSTNPEIVCVPVFYKGIAGKNFSEKITLSGYPTCAYAVDMYKAYLAQQRSNIAVEALSGVSSGSLRAISMGGQIVSNIPGAPRSSLISQISSIAGEMYNYSQKPPQAGGSQGSDTLVNIGQKDFLFMQKNITRNYAEMIDNYFDMFGYAVRQHLTPNMNARPNWTYCKTIGCIVHGNMPASAARDIESMFDNGVRFWKNHNNIGNYSLDNAPT